MTRAGTWQRIRRIWISVALGATTIFVVWSLIAFRPSANARRAQESDSTVRVTRGGGVRRFVPVATPSRNAGLLFFPGGLVDPTAYAPLARAVAEAGFEATIVELPRRGAFGGADAPELYELAEALLRDSAGPRRWIVAGHSRGAVIVSELADRRLPTVAGVVLIGTTHPRDVDLSGLTVPVTKVVATRDGLARPAGVAANRHLLPSTTRWVRIDGGNHSQFAWYGFQPGDRFAKIPAKEQRAVTVGAVIDALRAVAP